MTSFHKPIAIAFFAACGLFTTYFAATPDVTNNSYFLFTKAFPVDESGVVAVPSRYKWSVETCVVGFDVRSQPITDSRVMLRLYDPDQNFTALTAQMDLETAEKLQRELADLIAQKRQNPAFQLVPQLYDARLIPSGDGIGSASTFEMKANQPGYERAPD